MQPLFIAHKPPHTVLLPAFVDKDPCRTSLQVQSHYEDLFPITSVNSVTYEYGTGLAYLFIKDVFYGAIIMEVLR